jgi:ribosomal protein S12 methylthiotransferase accessory factor YcaO
LQELGIFLLDGEAGFLHMERFFMPYKRSVSFPMSDALSSSVDLEETLVHGLIEEPLSLKTVEERFSFDLVL